MADKQLDLFPEDESEKKPKTTPAQKTAAQQRKENRLARKERIHGRKIEEKARRREWERRKERGDVFGDMPPDFLQSARTTLQIGKKASQLYGIYRSGRQLLQIMNSLP